MSCATGPAKEPALLSEGEWQAKVLVTNKKSGKSNTLTLDLVARQPSQMRMDVTSTFGVYLASLVLNGDQIEYLLARERSFSSGAATPEALRQLIGLPLDPKLIHGIVFDAPFTEANWLCVRNAADRPVRCEHKDRSMAIEWKLREEGQRVIAFSAPQADLTMNLRFIQPKVQANESIFDLEPPKGFKIINLK